MKSEQETILKVAELLNRKDELNKEQISDTNAHAREMRAYALWSLDDRILALQWVLDQSTELDEVSGEVDVEDDLFE